MPRSQCTPSNAACAAFLNCVPKKPSPWPPFPPARHPDLARDAPDTRRTLAVAPLIGDKRCYGECPASVRRISGEAPAPSGGAERAYRGQPDYGYLAAATPRFQRIPLPPRHFRDRRFSPPGLCQIVAGRPASKSLSPARSVLPPWCMGGAAAVFPAFHRSSGLRTPNPGRAMTCV
jgi:hypothetical protein